jgi:AP-1 complex subunit beta-1
VVSNTVAALTDIHNTATQNPDLKPDDPAIFNVTPQTLNKLLIALNECSEWGRVALLNALARFQTADEKESEHICERVVPQFQHANGSVVLAAVKVRPSLSHALCIAPHYMYLLVTLDWFGALVRRWRLTQGLDR